MPWRVKEKQLQLWKSFFWAGFAWLAIGGSCALILLFQSVFPSFFEGISVLSAGRIQLHIGSTIVFGAAYPFILSLWLLRLYKLRAEPLFHFFPLLEGGFWTWNASLLFGFLCGVFGLHTTVPFFSWLPEVYACLMFSSVLFALALTFNLPDTTQDKQSPAFSLLLVGAWSLPVALLCFVAFSILRERFAPAMIQIILQLCLLLPLLGLLVPCSQQQLSQSLRQRFSFFFWGTLFLTPFAAPLFASASAQASLSTFAQVLLLVLLTGFFTVGWDLWKQPERFQHYFFHLTPHASTEASARPSATDTFKQLNPWQFFFFAGLACLGIAMLSAIVFGLLRIQGYPSSPTWQNSQTILLLVGCVFMWFQGLAFFLFPQHSETFAKHLRRLGLLALLGVLLFLIGSWFEAFIHLQLDQLNQPRGQIYPSLARFIRFFGGLAIGYAAISLLRQSILHIKQYRLLHHTP